jgi:hypothetical protein
MECTYLDWGILEYGLEVCLVDGWSRSYCLGAGVFCNPLLGFFFSGYIFLRYLLVGMRGGAKVGFSCGNIDYGIGKTNLIKWTYYSYDHLRFYILVM